VSEAQYQDVATRKCHTSDPRGQGLRTLKDLQQDSRYPILRTLDSEAPNITAIVCSNRHHVRFYLVTEGSEDMNRNNRNANPEHLLMTWGFGVAGEESGARNGGVGVL
jgi:hypothetical protein